MSNINQPEKKLDDEQRFEQFLKNSLQHHPLYLDDNGFTQSVLTRLPKRFLSRWQERFILCVPAFMIALLVLAQLPFNVLIVKIALTFTVITFYGLLKIGAIIAFVTAVVVMGLASRYRVF